MFIHGNSITLVKLARTLSDIMAVILESKRLGAIVTTRIPYLARSLVIGRVREAMAPLEALYATAYIRQYIPGSRSEDREPWPG
jgi:hypothetical protein